MERLILIGEKINYSIPRIGKLLDARDFAAIQKIARAQEAGGADYIDVNVGPLPSEVMRDAVKAVEEAVGVPLCIDSTDAALLEAGIRAHDPRRLSGTGANRSLLTGPILNSAIEKNADRVLALRERFACQVVLLVSERMDGSALKRNVTPEQATDTARRLFRRAREAGFCAGEIYIDPGTAPIASDIEGLVNTALETIGLVRSDPYMSEAHVLVGISNLTAGLPLGIRPPLQNAFLTLALTKGLDTLIGDPGREYRTLEADDPYLSLFERILACAGPRRLEELISSALYRSAVQADGMNKAAEDRRREEPK
jgi:cobalamin-dependent methionine synthase I